MLPWAQALHSAEILARTGAAFLYRYSQVVGASTARDKSAPGPATRPICAMRCTQPDRRATATARAGPPPSPAAGSRGPRHGSRFSSEPECGPGGCVLSEIGIGEPTRLRRCAHAARSCPPAPPGRAASARPPAPVDSSRESYSRWSDQCFFFFRILVEIHVWHVFKETI